MKQGSKLCKNLGKGDSVGRRGSQCKDPGAGLGLVCWRNSEEAHSWSRASEVGIEKEKVEGQQGWWVGDTFAVGSPDVNGHDVCPEGSQ